MYNQNDLENIDTQGYFTNLIDELEKSFNTKKIKIYLEVKDTLDVQNSIHCGIILNELITNSFKYAFKDGEGVISIKLIKKDKKHIFTVEDNGVGFDYEPKTTRFLWSLFCGEQLLLMSLGELSCLILQMVRK